MRSAVNRLRALRQSLREEHSLATSRRLRKAAWPLAMQLKPRSMLHEETLLALFLRAQDASGAVLEIGPYTGCSTVMLAKGVEASHRASPVITIEVGGSYDHPAVPSTDILADLRATLALYRVSERVTIVEGWSNVVQAEVAARLGGEKIGLLFIDADGEPGRDFTIYRPMLRDDAFLVVDDYVVSGGIAQLKADATRPWVDGMVERGAVQTIGVYPWGTWFGRLTGRPS